MLCRQGWRDNYKRVDQHYWKQGLSKQPRPNKASHLRQPKQLVTVINEIWSMDFYGPPANRKRRLVAVNDSRLSIRPVVIQAFPDLACMM
jgi:putative transposase